MADGYSTTLHLETRRNNITNTRVLSFRTMETYVHNGIANTSPVHDLSLLQLTPELMGSRQWCFYSILCDLSRLGIKDDTCIWLADKISSNVIHIASLVGDGVGFYMEAIIEDVYEPLVRDISGYDYLHLTPRVDVNEAVSIGATDQLLNYIEEALNSGVTTSVIENLRKNGKINGRDVSGVKCPICLEEFINESNVLKMTCSHLFHDSCIVKWLQSNNTCPMCRKIID